MICAHKATGRSRCPAFYLSLKNPTKAGTEPAKRPRRSLTPIPIAAACSPNRSSTTSRWTAASCFRNVEGPKTLTLKPPAAGKTKIFDVKRHQAVRSACDGCRKDVAVFGMVLHLRDKMLIVLDDHLRKELPHGSFAVAGLLRGLSEPADECARHFCEDLARPSGLVKCRRAPPDAAAYRPLASEPERRRRERRRGISSQPFTITFATRRCRLRESMRCRTGRHRMHRAPFCPAPLCGPLSAAEHRQQHREAQCGDACQQDDTASRPH